MIPGSRAAVASCHDDAPRAPVVGDVDVALVGRPNAGKSSLYNAVTGGSAKVGNFPGVTVDVLEATMPLPGGGRARVLDLPGVYALSSELDPDCDEAQALACIEDLEKGGKPFCIAQVVDASQLALGLRLTLDLLRRRLPLVVLVTQRDVLEKAGKKVDERALREALGVPVLIVSARDADVRERVAAAIRDAATTGFAPAEPRDIDAASLARAAVTDHASARERARRAWSSRADAVLLHPVVGPVVFLGLMTALFAAVFLVADPASNAMNALMGWLGARVVHLLGVGWLSSFFADAVLGGAGTVLAFLPQIVILTVAMEIIDASGYLSRGAFLVDRVLRFAGLGGKSFVPLLTAHACAVPAITSTRIIRDPGQRLRTLLVLPLMTCSARIPTYALLIAAFFGKRSPWLQSLLFVGLYFAGILSGLVASLVIGKTVKHTGRALPLVLEMPAYRMPQARVVWAMARRGAGRFVKEVGTFILLASVALWVLLKVPAPFAAHQAGPPGATAGMVQMENSIAGHVGHALEPITRPAGFDWRIDVGLIGSFGARELMVSTMGIIFGIEHADDNAAPLAEKIRDARGPDGLRAYSAATGLALMAFFVLACQCMSTVAALRRETRSWKWPAFVLAYSYAAAFVLAIVVFQVARVFGG